MSHCWAKTSTENVCHSRQRLRGLTTGAMHGAVLYGTRSLTGLIIRVNEATSFFSHKSRPTLHSKLISVSRDRDLLASVVPARELPNHFVEYDSQPIRMRVIQLRNVSNNRSLLLNCVRLRVVPKPLTAMGGL